MRSTNEMKLNKYDFTLLLTLLFYIQLREDVFPLLLFRYDANIIEAIQTSVITEQLTFMATFTMIARIKHGMLLSVFKPMGSIQPVMENFVHFCIINLDEFISQQIIKSCVGCI